ncbi:hypothetical protein CUMW_122980 [Citrus unshiu]|uniref:Enoyl-ACP reductase n=1 Tax=Citrus unshiu TaxID=55188 RepID=A0A2H5PC66_CITUN|nr:hypothetical protein CUMW_122980 [Citrus unshiu]
MIKNNSSKFSPSVLHFSTFTKRPPSVSLQTGTVTTLQSLDLIELNYFKLSKASSAFVFFQRNPPKRERKKPFFLTQYFSLFLTLALPIVQRYLFSSARVGALKMAATAACSLQMAAVKPCISSSHRGVKAGVAVVGGNSKGASWTKLSSASHISSGQPFLRSFTSSSVKFDKVVTRAMAESSTNKPISGLPIDLKGKRAFIAGVADDNGYGWAIAKSLAAAGAEILVGTWVPALNIFETSLRRGKFDESRVLPDGSLMEITKIYPLDAIYDKLEDVPEDVKSNKRYSGSSKWTVQECAESVKQDFGSIDILVHSLANGPEVSKPLLETSRNGYLAALSASSGSSLSLTYIASERIIPGYGGGMSSAKAALESDTRVLAFEAGRKHRIRVNAISAGPLRSRAAKAIGFIDTMIEYSLANAPLQKELSADEVGNTAAFLASPLASAITGAVIYVDNGLNAMGVGVDSPIFKDLDIPTDKH